MEFDRRDQSKRDRQLGGIFRCDAVFAVDALLECAAASDAYAYADSNPNSYPDSNANSYTDADTNSYAHPNPDA
jgi:hypothetical protein